MRAGNAGPDGFSGVFYVICSGFLDVFHKFVRHTPGEAELLAVFAAYAADRLLPKHLRRRFERNHKHHRPASQSANL